MERASPPRPLERLFGSPMRYDSCSAELSARASLYSIKVCSGAKNLARRYGFKEAFPTLQHVPRGRFLGQTNPRLAPRLRPPSVWLEASNAERETRFFIWRGDKSMDSWQVLPKQNRRVIEQKKGVGLHDGTWPYGERPRWARRRRRQR